MKKLLMLLAASLLGSGAYAQHLGTEYRLKKVIQVPARQGIAADERRSEQFEGRLCQHYRPPYQVL